MDIPLPNFNTGRGLTASKILEEERHLEHKIWLKILKQAVLKKSRGGGELENSLLLIVSGNEW